MFPKYSEVVKVSFTQVVANHLTDEFTPAEVAKMHAEFLSAMNALIPNGEVIKFSIETGQAVHLKLKFLVAKVNTIGLSLELLLILKPNRL